MPQLRKKPKKWTLPSARPLLAGHFYHVGEAWQYFGFRSSELSLKIKAGEIPPPIALSPGGRAKGWFGRTILQWQEAREAAAKLERDQVA